jgi:hypothetical protein
VPRPPAALKASGFEPSGEVVAQKSKETSAFPKTSPLRICVIGGEMARVRKDMQNQLAEEVWSQQKGSRRSWARNEMGNLRL